MKAGTNFQQRTYAPAQFAVALRWVGYAREDFKQGAAGVSPDDAQRLPLPDVECDILERPDGIGAFIGAPRARALPNSLYLVGDEVAQGIQRAVGRCRFYSALKCRLPGWSIQKRSLHHIRKSFSMRRKKNKPEISSSTTTALEIMSVKSGGVPKQSPPEALGPPLPWGSGCTDCAACLPEWC